MLCSILLEQSLLKSPIVRCYSSLYPVTMVSEKKVSNVKFGKLVDRLYRSKRLSSRGSHPDVFLKKVFFQYSCCIFSEHLLLRTPLDGFFWSLSQADNAKWQYNDLIMCVCVVQQEKFSSFDYESDRVERFSGQFIENNKRFSGLWTVCIFAFVLAHGQRQIERGVNTSKAMLVENLTRSLY